MKTDALKLLAYISLLMTCILLTQLAVVEMETSIVKANVDSFGSSAFLCCLKVMLKLL